MILGCHIPAPKLAHVVVQVEQLGAVMPDASFASQDFLAEICVTLTEGLFFFKTCLAQE